MTTLDNETATPLTVEDRRRIIDRMFMFSLVPLMGNVVLSFIDYKVNNVDLTAGIGITLITLVSIIYGIIITNNNCLNKVCDFIRF